ncbi:hypothetical protein EVAR_102315_1 [Eumeta japonica]|uniref:Uncharacterized protein n=1 Tax=Eumeta variegata TaxID=151549 RepID=A0A4C1WFX0_EUMVA|nr:hypothetical protein EVAR_102315_1 [Eumeta japonica]
MPHVLREKDIEEMLAALGTGDISEDNADVDDKNYIDYSDVYHLMNDLENENDEEPVLVNGGEHLPSDSPPVESTPSPSSAQLVATLGSNFDLKAWMSRSRGLIKKMLVLTLIRDIAIPF